MFIKSLINPDTTSKEVDSLCIEKGEEVLTKYTKRSALEPYREIDLSWPQKKTWGHVRAFDWESVLNSAYTELGGKSVYLFARSPGGKGLN